MVDERGSWGEMDPGYAYVTMQLLGLVAVVSSDSRLKPTMIRSLFIACLATMSLAFGAQGQTPTVGVLNQSEANRTTGTPCFL